jgi:hypothetical protein
VVFPQYAFVGTLTLIRRAAHKNFEMGRSGKASHRSPDVCFVVKDGAGQKRKPLGEDEARRIAANIAICRPGF